jgi:hypothetical protein
MLLVRIDLARTGKTAKQRMDQMRDHVPTDPEFEDRFRSAGVSQSFLAPYYLRTLVPVSASGRARTP